MLISQSENSASCAIKVVAPFKATFIGAVLNPGALEMTQAGQSKRLFELADEQGTWLSCLALGKHSAARALAHGVQVALYGCSGRPGTGSLPSTLLLAKDSVTVATGQTGGVQKRVKLDMSSDQD